MKECIALKGFIVSQQSFLFYEVNTSEVETFWINSSREVLLNRAQVFYLFYLAFYYFG